MTTPVAGQSTGPFVVVLMLGSGSGVSEVVGFAVVVGGAAVVGRVVVGG